MRGQTPSHHAHKVVDGEMVQILINAGANVDARDGENRTPLHLAIENGDKGVVQALIKMLAPISMLKMIRRIRRCIGQHKLQ